MSFETAQRLLDDFAEAMQFPQGLSLSEAGEITFLSDGRLEIGVAAVETPPTLLLSATLGSVAGQTDHAMQLVESTTAADGSVTNPSFVLIEGGNLLGLVQEIPLQDMFAGQFQTLLERFVETGLETMDQLARFSAKSDDGAEGLSAEDMSNLIIRI